MDSVQPWMRLKVKADTFFLPDETGAVYFRNNLGSFHMEGTSVQAWVEKLLPAFKGQHTLSSLTEGLPAPYRNRIYEIADILLKNGYLRDVSTDTPHQLSDEVLCYYAPQIAFVDNLAGDGGARFEKYRRANVLAVGTSRILSSLVSALLESGLATVNMADVTSQGIIVINPTSDGTPPDRTMPDGVTTDGTATDSPMPDGTTPGRLAEFIAELAAAGIKATVQDVSHQVDTADSWREMVRQMDAVLYVSETGDRETIRQLESLCADEHRVLFSALCINGLGIAVSSRFDDAWRRIHAPVFPSTRETDLSWPASSLLGNVLAFQVFKSLTDLDDKPHTPQLYTLNLATLEGKWHRLPSGVTGITGVTGMRGGWTHRMVNWKTRLTADVTSRWTMDPQPSTESVQTATEALLNYFASLTDDTVGIFHAWDEADLPQLPLATCQVQPIDPLSDGPARLLSNTACTGLTHEEARCAAGLTGIEMYAARFADESLSGEAFADEALSGGPITGEAFTDKSIAGEAFTGKSIAGEPRSNASFIGVGTGTTVAEALWRGLQQCLLSELRSAVKQVSPEIQRLEFTDVRDEKCQFYLQALSRFAEPPVIGRSQEHFGFPVAWIGMDGHFVGCVGLNLTMALQRALEYTLLAKVWEGSNGTRIDARWVVESSTCVIGGEAPVSIAVETWNGFTASESDVVAAAFEQVERTGRTVTVWDLAVEPFLTQGLGGVFGVSIERGSVR